MTDDYRRTIKMNPGNEFAKLEQALVRAGRGIAYPATPGLAARVRATLEAEQRRRIVWLPRPAFIALAALVIAFALLIAFPETRDALAQFLGLRTIRIIPVTPTTTPQSLGTRSPVAVVPVTATPQSGVPTLTPVPRIQCCETTLADAQAKSRFKILLPPSQSPNLVYLQSIPSFGIDAQQVILVFGDPRAPQFTLFEATNFLYGKMVSGGTVIEETQVKRQRALWLTGAPHLLVYLDANGQPRFDSERSVNANTLAWEIGEVTYRLETPLSKEEAIRLAESLQ